MAKSTNDLLYFMNRFHRNLFIVRNFPDILYFFCIGDAHLVEACLLRFSVEIIEDDICCLGIRLDETLEAVVGAEATTWIGHNCLPEFFFLPLSQKTVTGSSGWKLFAGFTSVSLSTLWVLLLYTDLPLSTHVTQIQSWSAIVQNSFLNFQETICNWLYTR